VKFDDVTGIRAWSDPHTLLFKLCKSPLRSLDCRVVAIGVKTDFDVGLIHSAYTACDGTELCLGRTD